ncbi:MAG: lysophospholipid acyltransferase family protein [Thiohalomonadales bacterium]
MLRLIFRFIAILPLPITYLLAWPIGGLLYVLRNNQRHIAEVNIALCYPELDVKAQAAMCRRSMVETVKNMFDSVKIWMARDRGIFHLVKTVTNESLLLDALEQKRGVLLLLPHLGNWELVCSYVSSKHAVTGLYRPQKSSELDKIILEGRQVFGGIAVPASKLGVRRLLKALRDNQLLLILPDQNPGKGTGQFVPFYSIQTNTPVLPARLAQKTGAVVITAYAKRLPYARGYDIKFAAARPQLMDADMEIALTAMNADIEDKVRCDPTQYWWGYSRFRHRPPGEPSLYKKD